MKYEHYTPEAVILANGEYPSHPLPLQMLENAEFVVCCDGAANEYILRGHTPDVIIGDGDSLSPAPMILPLYFTRNTLANSFSGFCHANSRKKPMSGKCFLTCEE